LNLPPSACLPAEIIEYSSPEETAVCNLASIALPRFVKEKEPSGRDNKKLCGSLDAEGRCAKWGIGRVCEGFFGGWHGRGRSVTVCPFLAHASTVSLPSSQHSHTLCYFPSRPLQVL
jgi:hypothetical protein